jgi:perosamine synthetase
MNRNQITIPLVAPSFDGNELAYLTECIQTGWVSHKGPFVRKFEESIANFCRVQNAVAVSSGTAALHLALMAIGVKPGDEVIVPVLSYISTANVIAYTGALPVFIDSEGASWNMDLLQLQDKISPKTKAIMVVHLYGHLVDMDRLLEIAQRHNLAVIEDACEALGGEYRGRMAGTLGTIGCFSFFPNKLITTGEGGMVVTNSEPLAARVRLLRNQAAVGRTYHYSEIGFNYRMTNLQAAVGVAQMERIEQFIENREQVIKIYNQALKNLDGISLYHEPEWSKNGWWLFSILLKDELGVDRDQMISYLMEHGIESKPFFELQTSVATYHTGEAFPVAQDLSSHGINLPTNRNLNKKTIEKISNIIKAASGSFRPLGKHA